MAGEAGHAAWEVGVADDRDALVGADLAGLGHGAVAALFGGEIDDDGAGLHALDHAGGDELERKFT